MTTINLPSDINGVSFKGQFYTKDNNGNVEIPDSIAAYITNIPGVSTVYVSGTSGYSGHSSTPGYSGYSLPSEETIQVTISDTELGITYNGNFYPAVSGVVTLPVEAANFI